MPTSDIYTYKGEWKPLDGVGAAERPVFFPVADTSDDCSDGFGVGCGGGIDVDESDLGPPLASRESISDAAERATVSGDDGEPRREVLSAKRPFGPAHFRVFEYYQAVPHGIGEVKDVFGNVLIAHISVSERRGSRSRWAIRDALYQSRQRHVTCPGFVVWLVSRLSISAWIG